jgi:hypothetical protein
MELYIRATCAHCRETKTHAKSSEYSFFRFIKNESLLAVTALTGSSRRRIIKIKHANCKQEEENQWYLEKKATQRDLILVDFRGSTGCTEARGNRARAEDQKKGVSEGQTAEY